MAWKLMFTIYRQTNNHQMFPVSDLSPTSFATKTVFWWLLYGCGDSVLCEV